MAKVEKKAPLEPFYFASEANKKIRVRDNESELADKTVQWTVFIPLAKQRKSLKS